MKIKQRVYIMGPYSEGDQILNVKDAIDLAERVVHAGGVPFIPHLFHFWHFQEPHMKVFWMELDKQMMHACHSIISTTLLSRASSGMKEELAYNKENLGLPVYTYKQLLSRGFKFNEVEA